MSGLKIFKARKGKKTCGNNALIRALRTKLARFACTFDKATFHQGYFGIILPRFFPPISSNMKRRFLTRKEKKWNRFQQLSLSKGTPFLQLLFPSETLFSSLKPKPKKHKLGNKNTYETSLKSLRKKPLSTPITYGELKSRLTVTKCSCDNSIIIEKIIEN